MPEGVEAGKVVGSTIYGARAITIRGNYDDVNRLCSEIADKYGGWAFVNINPRHLYTEGAKTFRLRSSPNSFSIGGCRTISWCRPPAGPSCRRWPRAFKELKEVGLAQERRVQVSIPRRPPAPHRSSMRCIRGQFDLITPVKPDTIAKPIVIGNPADGSLRASKPCAIRADGATLLFSTWRSSTRSSCSRAPREFSGRACRRHHARGRAQAAQAGPDRAYRNRGRVDNRQRLQERRRRLPVRSISRRSSTRD